MAVRVHAEHVGPAVIVKCVQEKVDFIFHVETVARYTVGADASRFRVERHVNTIEIVGIVAEVGDGPLAGGLAVAR